MSPGRRRRPNLKLNPVGTDATRHVFPPSPANRPVAISDDLIMVPENQQAHTVLVSTESDVASSLRSEDRPRTESVQSATSSLDTYYFSPSSSEPPAPSSPQRLSAAELVDSGSSDATGSFTVSLTPAREEALSVDRRALVGVGELATPRWISKESSTGAPWLRTHVEGITRESIEEHHKDFDSEEHDPIPDSPWTIEAIDGETDDMESASLREIWSPDSSPTAATKLLPLLSASPTRSLRQCPSITSESGGDEVLYPRRARMSPSSDVEGCAPSGSSADKHSNSQPLFAAGEVPLSKTSFDKLPVYRHIANVEPSESPKRKNRDRRKADSVGPSLGSSLRVKTNSHEPHSRHTSNSSSSSAPEVSTGGATKRHTALDFSHLPPSPSSSSIQQFLRSPPPHASSSSPSGQSKNAGPSSSPKSAAHSLLRGMQEGWSGLDDQATVEVLRKLDGVSGKSVKSRLSLATGSSVKTSSRPGTPGLKPSSSSDQWEGIGVDAALVRAISRRGSSASNHTNIHVGTEETLPSTSSTPARKSSLSTSSTRSSLAAKRSSNLSTAPSSVVTEASQHPPNPAKASMRNRRDSVGSDTAGIQQENERSANLLVGHSFDVSEVATVPPVPPLPKDVMSSKVISRETISGIAHNPGDLPSANSTIQKHQGDTTLDDQERTLTLDVSDLTLIEAGPLQRITPPPLSPMPESSLAPNIPAKTPSRKWSFSNALNLRLGVSPGSSFSGDTKQRVVSPRSSSFSLKASLATLTDGRERRKSSLPWLSQEEAMSSAGSLCSNFSVQTSDGPLGFEKENDSPNPSPPQTDTASDGNETGRLNATASSPLPRRSSSSKRLTPSAIPFFRRSSSQTHGAIVTSNATVPVSNSNSLDLSKSSRSSEDNALGILAPPSAGRKGSVLSLGLPSLLKGSSSRRSVQSERHDIPGDDAFRDRAYKETTRNELQLSSNLYEKQKSKKDKGEKDRSESRISILMGRRRGQTMSATDAQKPKPVENLPPMQMPTIASVTLQRVTNMRDESSSSPSISGQKKSTLQGTSRVNAATISSMAKQSESTLRSRGTLPTIAGSPSVPSKDSSSLPSTSTIHGSMASREAPTKIPRISSGILASSPLPSVKGQPLPAGSRRASLNVVSSASENGGSVVSSVNLGEFGVLTPQPENAKQAASDKERLSPQLISKIARQGSMLSVASSSGTVITHKAKRDSISLSGTRKSSASSNLTAAPHSQAQPQSRFAALSPSKSLKFLTPKSSLPAARMPPSTSQIASPSSSRQTLSSPSPLPSSLDDDELAADEEMRAWMKRQQSKRASNPSKKDEVDELLRVPENFEAKSPTPPTEVLRSPEGIHLSEYERKEIFDHPSVFYCGSRCNKKQATVENTTNNHGYDDERGDYIVVTGDHLAYRYEIVDTLGKGSFGQVLRCRDYQTGQSVAVKIIRNKKRFHHQALVEIKILDNLRKWDPDEKHYVLKMTEYFYFRNHLCIATELLSINLYELIKANGFIGFTTTLIRRFTAQLLASLSLMRHHRIVHCDLKPENVLLKHPAKSAIKVIDFGSSCLEHEKVYTYIQSRFYRSPEVILGMNYHMAIDMWSLGCILAELYTGFPIFPGENEQEQLSCIMEVLGAPEKELVNRSSRKRLFFDSTGAPRPVVNSKGRRRRPGAKTLAQVLRCDDDLFVDFVGKCLIWDPERRLKPQPAMRHPYMTATRRSKAVTNTPNTTARSLLGNNTSLISSASKGKSFAETPSKKSQISAPTPLTSRVTRPPTLSIPGTPVSQGQAFPGTSSNRTIRNSQSSGAAYQTHTVRPLSGYVAS